MDNRCAPGKDFEDGSCLTKDSLVKIVENFNIENPNEKLKMNDSPSKSKIVSELKSKMKNRSTHSRSSKIKTYSIIDVVGFRNDVYLRVKRYDSQVMGYGSIRI